MSRKRSFTKDEFDSMIKQFDESLKRSTRIASDVQQINEMQSEEIQRLHQTFDRTDEHLENVEKQIEEIHRSFCCQLCCSAKSTRRKSPIEKKSKEKVRSSFVAEENPILTNENLRMIDENLQKLQHFNRLIDEEIHDQIETLNLLEKRVDVETHRLNKVNVSTKDLV